MDNKILWVWLSLKISPGKMTIPALLEEYGDIEEIYREKNYTYSAYLSFKERRSLADKSLESAYDVCRRTDECGAKILVYDDEKYPENLRQIDSPPYVLYVKGKVIDWDRYLLISVIGTRDCTQYGVNVTRRIAGGLAEQGVVIVSGLAKGLDSAATAEALRYNSYSVGVLGCSIDKIYPLENKALYNAVEKTGILISEYPPGSNNGKSAFPLRNRIIAGISSGLLVTEAPLRSGTNITVNYAYDYNKDVFAVPGSIFEKNNEGTNRLLKGSAKATVCAEDILEEYPDIAERQRAPMGNIFIEELPEIEALIESGIIKKDNKREGMGYSEYRTASGKAGRIGIGRRSVFSRKSTEIYERQQSDKIAASEPKEQETNDKKRLPEGLSKDEKLVAEVLLGGEKMKDEIIRETALDAGDVNTMLILLEMQGAVEVLPGNIYRLK
ncbi:MAG: DNA-processing protein DprA [bacterium]|nr:DNA-processing protein DprA [bacterium]